MPGKSSAPEGIVLPDNFALHQVSVDTVALWQLQKDIADATGTYDLSISTPITFVPETGVIPNDPQSRHMVLGYGAELSNSALPNRPSNDAGLTLLGELTLMCLVYRYSSTVGNDYLMTMNASGETEATNYPWSLSLNSSGQVRYFAESGAGANQEFSGTGGSVTNNQWTHIALTRATSGEVTTYINGVSTGTSSGLSSPTGGSSTRLYLGGGPSLDDLEGKMCSALVEDREWTGAQVLAEANRIMADW